MIEAGIVDGSQYVLQKGGNAAKCKNDTIIVNYSTGIIGDD